MALELSYTGSGVIAANTVLLGPIDSDKARSISFHITSIGTSGALIVQQSNDGINWVSTLSHNITGVNVNNMGAGIYWTNPIGRYVRVIMYTATTAGNTAVYARISSEQLSNLPHSMTGVAVQSMPATPAGTNLIGASTCSMSATPAMGAQFSMHKRLASTADVNAVSVKTSAGRIASIRCVGATATTRYLKLYNKASNPTVGTDVPVLTYVIRGNSEFELSVADLGIYFSAGIAYAITAGSSDTDATAILVGDVACMNILYI